MAVRPSPDRSDLESKTREDLQTIAKVKGVDVSARASKASLIEAIMGDPAPNGDSPESVSRAVRSRRTVATPTDDFDDLLGEFVADASTDRATSSDADATTTEPAPVCPRLRVGVIIPTCAAECVLRRAHKEPP